VLTVKLPVLLAVPPGVVTKIFPVVAVAGTVAEIWVPESTAKLAAVPLNLTKVAPVKPVPVMTTDVPTGPEVGVNDVMVGAAVAVTVKLPELVAVPPDVVTEIFPVVAVAGTVAVIWVPELAVKLAAVPFNLTEVAPVKPDPEIATEVPGGPLIGENPEIVGAGEEPPQATLFWCRTLWSTSFQLQPMLVAAPPSAAPFRVR
jgi:hypothetical protein